MMPSKQGTTQQKPQGFNLDTFLRLTTPQIFDMGSQPWADLQKTTFKLPQTGLGSELMITLSGTITVSGTVTGGTFKLPGQWALLNRVNLTSLSNLRTIDISGYGLYRYVRTRYGYDPLSEQPGIGRAGNNASFGIGTPAIVPGANVAAGTYAVNWTLPVPLAYNRELLAGLLNLQSQNVIFPLDLQAGSITSGISATGGTNDLFNNLTGSGLSVTANLTYSVNCEVMTVPANYQPELSMFLSLSESSYAPLTAGINTVKPAPNDIFTMFIASITNNGNPIPASQVANATFMYAGNQRRYSENPTVKMGWEYWNKGVIPLDGDIVWDLGIRRGLKNKRDLYDAFNDARVTDLQLQFALSGSLVPAGINQIGLISESLRYVQQR